MVKQYGTDAWPAFGEFMARYIRALLEDDIRIGSQIFLDGVDDFNRWSRNEGLGYEVEVLDGQGTDN
jgi:hypothetical protein